jgi:hypothetical protein
MKRRGWMWMTKSNMARGLPCLKEKMMKRCGVRECSMKVEEA